MTLTEIRAFTRFLTNTNSTTYTDADLDANVKNYNYLFTTEILESMDEWEFQGEVATGSTVEDQQEYILPTDILKIKRVEITYDGTTWYEARPMDINEKEGATDTTSIGNDFTQSEPKYDLMDNSIMFYPIPDATVVSSIKIWYENLPTALSAGTSPEFAEPFHRGLAYGAAKDYFDKYLESGANADKSIKADNNMEKYIQRMKIFYRKRNQDRKYVVDINDTDYEYDNG